MLSFHSLNRTDLPPVHKPAPPPPKKKNSDMKGHLTSDDIQVSSSPYFFSLLILLLCGSSNTRYDNFRSICLFVTLSYEIQAQIYF